MYYFSPESLLPPSKNNNKLNQTRSRLEAMGPAKWKTQKLIMDNRRDEGKKFPRRE